MGIIQILLTYWPCFLYYLTFILSCVASQSFLVFLAMLPSSVGETSWLRHFLVPGFTDSAGTIHGDFYQRHPEASTLKCEENLFSTGCSRRKDASGLNSKYKDTREWQSKKRLKSPGMRKYQEKIARWWDVCLTDCCNCPRQTEGGIQINWSFI